MQSIVLCPQRRRLSFPVSLEESRAIALIKKHRWRFIHRYIRGEYNNRMIFTPTPNSHGRWRSETRMRQRKADLYNRDMEPYDYGDEAHDWELEMFYDNVIAPVYLDEYYWFR